MQHELALHAQRYPSVIAHKYVVGAKAGLVRHRLAARNIIPQIIIRHPDSPTVLDFPENRVGSDAALGKRGFKISENAAQTARNLIDNADTRDPVAKQIDKLLGCHRGVVQELRKAVVRP